MIERNLRTLTKADYLYIFERQAGICAVCLQSLESGEFGWTGFGVHHIKKRSQGGGNEFENLVMTHNYCNQALENRPDLARKLNLVKLKEDENIRFSKSNLGGE